MRVGSSFESQQERSPGLALSQGWSSKVACCHMRQLSTLSEMHATESSIGVCLTYLYDGTVVMRGRRRAKRYLKMDPEGTSP